jgi:hypothetical protein
MKTYAVKFAGIMLLAASLVGCSTHIYPMAKAFPINGVGFSGGAPVTVLPVQESSSLSSKDSEYQSDPYYLGSGLAFLEVEGIVPIIWFEDKFQSDTQRKDIIQSALSSKLATHGIPVASGQSVLPAEDHLTVNLRVQELSVDTALNGFLTVIITSGFSFRNQVCHAVLSYEFSQPGQDKPIYSGTAEGVCQTSKRDVGGYTGSPENTFDKIVERTNVVTGAIAAAVEKCVVKLAEVRTKVSSERYARLMKEGADLEAGGDTAKALEDYGQASTSATTAGQDDEAMQALVRLLRVTGTPPEMSADARKLKVQAEAAYRDGRFDEAAQLYADTVALAPWWAEGHQELAQLLGAGGHYAQAIREMKRYQLLNPNTTDTHGSQDKIYEWEQKMAAQTQAVPSTPPAQDSTDGSFRRK